MASSASRIARHLPVVAAFATTNLWTPSSKCEEAPSAQEVKKYGMVPDAKGDYRNLFPKRQLWQPKLGKACVLQ